MYWSAAVPVVALVLWSAMGSLPRAFFLAVMLLPGVLLFKYFVDGISFKDRRQGVLNTLYVVLAVMLVEYLGVFFVYFNIEYPFTETPPRIVMNPLFLWLLTGALLSIEWLLENRLGAGKEPVREKFITFTSDRRRTTLELDTILYIESLDDEVAVVVEGGTRYPTRMNISGWEAVLDDRFVRVHRSFIVNLSHVTRIEGHFVWIGDVPIVISRKYRDKVTGRIEKTSL